MEIKRKSLKRIIREEIERVIREDNKGVLYSYAGDINIYDLTRAPQGRDGAPQTGNKIVALEFNGTRVELTPNEAESLYKAVKTIHQTYK